MVEVSRVVGMALTASQATPPGWLTSGGAGWAVVRRYWRGLCAWQVYRQRENWLGLTLGTGLQVYAGEVALVRAAALVAAFSAHITTAAEKLSCARQATERLFRRLYAKELVVMPTPWVFGDAGPRWLSPSTLNTWVNRYRFLRQYCLDLIAAALKAAWLWLYCFNSVAEAADALSWEPEAQGRNVREIFINIGQVIEQLTQNGPKLIESLIQSRAILDAILKSLHAPFDAEAFIGSVTKVLHATRKVQDLCRPIAESYGEEVTDIARKGLFGVFAGSGPNYLIPRLPNVQAQPNQSDFPSRHALTRLSFQKDAVMTPRQEANKVTVSATPQIFFSDIPQGVWIKRQ